MQDPSFDSISVVVKSVISEEWRWPPRNRGIRCGRYRNAVFIIYNPIGPLRPGVVANKSDANQYGVFLKSTHIIVVSYLTQTYLFGESSKRITRCKTVAFGVPYIGIEWLWGRFFASMAGKTGEMGHFDAILAGNMGYKACSNRYGQKKSFL